MGKLLNLVTPLHQSTKRNYLSRMQDDKVHCMYVAKKYDKDYWDGERRYGYGCYKYLPGRWKPVAEGLISEYQLNEESNVLDIGCGKAFLLHELKLLLPSISEHGIDHATEEIRPFLLKYKAQDLLPFGNDEFDLVFSIGTFNNLKLIELHTALQEMQRVWKQSYLMLESYRNEQELFNLQFWALTAVTFSDFFLKRK